MHQIDVYADRGPSMRDGVKFGIGLCLGYSLARIVTVGSLKKLSKKLDEMVEENQTK